MRPILQLRLMAARLDKRVAAGWGNSLECAVLGNSRQVKASIPAIAISTIGCWDRQVSLLGDYRQVNAVYPAAQATGWWARQARGCWSTQLCGTGRSVARCCLLLMIDSCICLFCIRCVCAFMQGRASNKYVSLAISCQSNKGAIPT